MRILYLVTRDPFGQSSGRKTVFRTVLRSLDRLGHAYPFFNGYFAQRIIYGRYIDGVGALNRTGIATHTYPDTGTFQGFFFQSQLHQTYYAIGRVIHGTDERTPSCTTLTMPAQIKIDSGALFNLIGKI